MSDAKKAYLYALTTVLFWSTVATAFKIALAYLDVFQLLFYACLSSVLVLLTPILVQSQLAELWREFRDHWRISLLAASLNPLCYYLILFAAYDRLPAQVAQPINYTWAIVLTLMSVIFLKQRPTRFDFIAVFVCYTGVLIIATQGQFDSIQIGQGQGAGLLLAIASTVVWSSYWILNIRDARDHRFAMCLNFLVALPISLAICLLFSSLMVAPEGLAAAAYVGIFEMGLAFLFWSRALRMADNTSRVSTLVFLSPFLSLYFINRFLGEVIYTTTYAGLVVIVAGLLIQRITVGRPDPQQP